MREFHLSNSMVMRLPWCRCVVASLLRHRYRYHSLGEMRWRTWTLHGFKAGPRLTADRQATEWCNEALHDPRILALAPDLRAKIKGTFGKRWPRNTKNRPDLWFINKASWSSTSCWVLFLALAGHGSIRRLGSALSIRYESAQYDQGPDERWLSDCAVVDRDQSQYNSTRPIFVCLQAACHPLY